MLSHVYSTLSLSSHYVAGILPKAKLTYYLAYTLYRIHLQQIKHNIIYSELKTSELQSILFGKLQMLLLLLNCYCNTSYLSWKNATHIGSMVLMSHGCLAKVKACGKSVYSKSFDLNFVCQRWLDIKTWKKWIIEDKTTRFR